MNTSMKAKPPRPGTARSRPTTLSLTDELWEGLREMERETGAKPSVIVRRLLESAIAKSRKPSPQSNPTP